MSKIEHIQLFNIIKLNNIIYTENENGIFINFKFLTDKHITIINDFISFCNDNNKSFKIKENILNEKIELISNNI